MNIDLEKLAKALNYLDEINDTKLKDIVWCVDGAPIARNSSWNEVLEHWKFTGLTNHWFAKEYLLDRDENGKWVQMHETPMYPKPPLITE